MVHGHAHDARVRHPLATLASRHAAMVLGLAWTRGALGALADPLADSERRDEEGIPRQATNFIFEAPLIKTMQSGYYSKLSIDLTGTRVGAEQRLCVPRDTLCPAANSTVCPAALCPAAADTVN